MAFIGFILLLCFLYWIFSSKDKLGDIDKANKVLEKFNSDLEKQIEKMILKHQLLRTLLLVRQSIFLVIC